MSEFIRDTLRMKDDARVQNAKLPALATMNREDAMKAFFEQQMETQLMYRVAAKCAHPCMTNMESPGVSQ